jgi:hypothetical protein
VSRLVDITEISAIVAAAGVLVGVAYYILEIRQQTKVRQDLARQRETELETRQAQLFMQLYDHYYDRDTMKDESEIIYQWKWKDFEDFWEKYGVFTNVEAFTKFDSWATYIKGVGVLVKRRLIDPDLVYDLMGTSIILLWEKYGSVIKEIRKRIYPHAYEWCEELYNEMKKREQKLQQSKA